MNTITLNNGVKMPIIGYGTYQVTDSKECVENIVTAVENGYRMIDTATCYGNESEVGLGIAKVLEQNLVKREDLFITTKVWFRDYGIDKTRNSLANSFKKLGVDYLDLVLLHWPFGDVFCAWKVLEEYYRAGRIKAIGVSNMEPARFIDLLSFNEVAPAVNQIETHLYCQRQEERKWLDKYKIVHEAYSPLGQGRAPEMLQEKVVLDLASKYQKTAAQVLLRFLTQKDIVVIPKSSHKERIIENIQIFDFELTAEEMNELQKLDRNTAFIGNSANPEKVEAAMKW